MVMTQAAQIVEALGGTSAVATALDLTPSTVSSWKTSGKIPRWRMPDVRALAQRRDVDLDTIFSGDASASTALCSVCELRAEDTAVGSCTSPSCPRKVRDAA
ncbi:hypothetical protein J2Y54_000551 [Sphingomonas sp. BE123]|uniref:carph-isopro domain-containing protein n=1 Tax=Sphingomonas sp. BE123 TaxID=2817842 RepID=UPI00285AAEA4|nr:hypothetical protein [Sphingomonas sp. BE123]MDR6851058.1 hypothetical protein [Sphingomonas sp. BE123]